MPSPYRSTETAKRRAKLLLAWPVVAVLGVFYTLLHPMGEYRMTMRSFMDDWYAEWRGE